MRRILLLGCLAWAAAAPAGRADVFGISPTGADGALTVVDGAPVRAVGGPGGGDWVLLRRTGQTTIKVVGPVRYKGMYLAYDPTGKRDGVFLVAKKGKGTLWSLEPPRGADAEVYRIRAAEGVNKGWYLDAGGKAERKRPAKGKPFDAHPLRLTKKPGVSRFEITRISP